MWEGTVVSIHIAREAAATMQSIAEVRAIPGRGLEGDRYFVGTGHYSKTPSYGGREVTLIEIEVIEALFRGVLNASGERCGISLSAADTRRNIATSGVALNHLVDREFLVGPVLMRGTRLCDLPELQRLIGKKAEQPAGVIVVVMGGKEIVDPFDLLVAKEPANHGRVTFVAAVNEHAVSRKSVPK